MGYIEMVVMTKSSKFRNYCVAGFNINSGEWVRLVTDNEDIYGALSREDLVYEDGTECKVLDVILVYIMEEDSNLIQPENVLIDTSTYIEKICRYSLEEVLDIHEPEIRKNILGNIYSYITEQRIDQVGYSLAFVEVQNLVIKQATNSDGKSKTKVDFQYGHNRYENLSVTDQNFYTVKDGAQFENAYLVVSIGPPYNKKYYKFVAKIFVL